MVTLATLVLDLVARVTHPEIFFLAPFLLLAFLRRSRQALPLLVLGSFSDDLLTLTPVGFHLLVISVALLILTIVARIVNADRLFGALLLFYLLLIAYLGALALLIQTQEINYLAYTFLINALYGSAVIAIAKLSA